MASYYKYYFNLEFLIKCLMDWGCLSKIELIKFFHYATTVIIRESSGDWRVSRPNSWSSVIIWNNI